MPPLDHLKFSGFFELFFCWCTCLAKLGDRLMNIAGDERMCGKYLFRASEPGRSLVSGSGDRCDTKHFRHYPPPPLNRAGFWRSRNISATTPPPH